MKFLRPKINIDEKLVEQFLTRGVENIFPSKEAFKKELLSGRQLSIYLGIDPTGATLHMGHAIPLMKLAQLQKLGHKIILLMGDFTAMIGDPTDKTSTRRQLSRREVLSNLKLYKKQASNFLVFSGSNAAKIVYNSKWLSRMNFADVLELASKMTVDQMLKRDMFRVRTEEGKPIFIHEFMYPLMQGYDSVAMNIDVEIGGNDQTFNMLTGRDLMKTLKNKEKFVVATKLLVDPTGKKMGKTEGNMITLNDSAADMFGKIMSWSDELIIPGFELCTSVDVSVIAQEREFIAAGGNPRDAKVRLACAVAALYHGNQAADKAREAFFSTFSSAGAAVIPHDAPMISVARDTSLVDALLSAKIVSSKTDFKRLVGEGAIKDMKGGEAITSFDMKISQDIDIKVGKHRFIKIRLVK